MSKPPLTVEPFAVRAKEAARLAGCGITELYRRLNKGIYEAFLDGNARFVTVESIRAHQQRQFAATRGTPKDNPSPRSSGGGPGRPKGRKK